jgi:3'-phosphoadenosine 5'-phosphosulfate sulfotransferase (PAPS reductase)/FAD synthetase
MFLTKAPFNISEKCCDWMKKKPLKHFVKGGEYKGFKPFIGILASESQQRRLNWTKYKCNAFGKKNMESMPLSIWLDDDIWAYIEKYNLDYSKIYDRGIARTGCIFCMFGVNLEEENRFEILRELHPKIYKYCINALGVGKVLDYLGIKYHDSKLIHHKNLKKRRKLK